MDRCRSVRRTGNQTYVACCPAHDDKHPSLSLKICSDGRVLLHCFAGCATEDVLAAVGLTFSDVMPDRVGKSHASKPRQWISAQDALEAIDHEALVVAITANDMRQYKKLEADTWSRLSSAVTRISRARFKVTKE